MQRSGLAVLGELEAVGLAQGGVGSHRKWLQVALAHRLDAQLAIVALHKRGRLLQLRTAGVPPAQFRRRQELDVVEIESGIDGGGRGNGDGGEDEACEEAPRAGRSEEHTSEL